MEQSMSILTPEDKRYLRKVSLYIQSYGMTYADIRLLELEEYPGFEIDDIDFENVTHLSNNYSVEVPEGLIPILKKVVDAGMIKMNSLDFPMVDYINYGGVDIEINCKSNEITLVYYHSYTDMGEENRFEFSVKDEDVTQELFNQINETDNVEPIMELGYYGSGDSGYFEDRFENGAPVPAEVEDWCGRALSRNVGLWGDNEGSQGKFLFYMEKNMVELYHIYNENIQYSTTLFEEEFGK